MCCLFPLTGLSSLSTVNRLRLDPWRDLILESKSACWERIERKNKYSRTAVCDTFSAYAVRRPVEHVSFGFLARTCWWDCRRNCINMERRCNSNRLVAGFMYGFYMLTHKMCFCRTCNQFNNTLSIHWTVHFLHTGVVTCREHLLYLELFCIFVARCHNLY